MEVQNALMGVMSSLHNLPPTSADRALVFPLALAGCLTDNAGERQYIKYRLSAQDESVGNVRSARLLMEQVWHVRDVQGGVVDWRDVMRDHLGMELLLV